MLPSRRLRAVNEVWGGRWRRMWREVEGFPGASYCTWKLIK